MSDPEDRMLDSDRPITSAESDRFGFKEIAEKLALSVISAAASDGMVIAVEGKWGSGKTSLVNLLRRAIEQKKREGVVAIPFSPWLLGNVESLVPQFMGAMAHALNEEHGDDEGLSKDLIRYGALAGHSLSPVLKTAGLLIPILGAIAKVIDDIATNLEKLGEKSISVQKEVISKRLANQKMRFIVLIDDLDRVEPREAVEVIRLIRSVADFPNVVYVLCYDKSVLAHAIQKGIGVEDGEHFLQKIVQVSFNVPQPEHFDLRTWLFDELQEIFDFEVGRQLLQEEYDDLFSAVTIMGVHLTTPRDVKMVLNAVKFHFPQVKEDTYYPDICWLFLVKILDFDLYEWVERYLSIWAVVGTRDAYPTTEEIAQFGSDLKQLVKSTKPDVSRSIHALSQFVPGLQGGITDLEDIKVFAPDSDQTIHMFERDKRLGSPVHSRLYFAFSTTKSSMTDENFQSVIQSMQADPTSARVTLLEYAKNIRPTGGSWFDYLVDRIARQEFNEWTGDKLVAISFMIADILDEAVADGNLLQSLGRYPVARQAANAVHQMMSVVRKKDDSLFSKGLTRIFSEANSISWLVQDFMDVGLKVYEQRNRGESSADSNFSDEELEVAKKILLSRLSKTPDRQRLFHTFNIQRSLILWKWMRNGDPSEPKGWFEEQTTEDGGFLTLLEAMRIWSQSDRVYWHLTPRSVGEFADWNETNQRLILIASNKDDPDKARRATDLISSIREDLT